jgi:3',5'-cyclic AMP phosphodiesterase CpdA
MNNIRQELLIAFVLLISTICQAQTSVLAFNKDGKFKIVQFTDVHFRYGNPASNIALERINEVIDLERPDLVIFTGDIVCQAPAGKGMELVLEQVSKHHIPFAFVFGNHDCEQDMNHAELYDLIRKVPGNLLPDRGLLSSPDYVLTIKSSNNIHQDAALLYCIDSHANSQLNGVDGYDWISSKQVQWYRNLSAAFTVRNQGNPLPSLAFFHIPLPEFHQAASNEGSILRGTRMEEVCSPNLNSGMFTAMKEAGDIMGIFVGHDHDNDYAVMWYNILLAYGRFSGGNTVYNHLPNGARVIVLKEGKRTFDTWIRQKDGVVDFTTYPDSYIKDNWEKR